MASGRHARPAAALSLAMLVAAAGPAFAAPPGDEHAAAVESFRRGTQLVELGKLQDAIDAFRDALVHEPSSVGARINLADCYEKVGAPAQAWHQYALAAAYAAAAGDARVAMARDAATHLRPQLLTLTLATALPFAPDHVDVRADGERMEPEIVRGRELALAPGRHRIEATVPGKPPSVQDVDGSAGERRVVTFVFTAEAPHAAAPQTSSWPAQKTWALVVGGTGAAGVVAGAVLGLVAASKRSTLSGEQTDPALGASAFAADLSSAKSFATASTVGFIAGGVVLAAGAVLWLTAPASSRPNLGPAGSRGLAVVW